MTHQPPPGPPELSTVLLHAADAITVQAPDGSLVYANHAAAGQILIDVRAEDGWAFIEITDHGVGIPAEELPQLFEKFHRGANTRELRGTGLGLAGSRAVVQQLNGTIEVRSRLGEGSTFQVRLPLTPSRAPES